MRRGGPGLRFVAGDLDWSTETPEYTKKVKRELRQLRDQAWEAELARALSELEARFAEWRDGKIDAFELNEYIHGFHRGPNRELHNCYTGLDRSIAVARGVALGLIPRDSVPEVVLDDIVGSIAFFEEERGAKEVPDRDR